MHFEVNSQDFTRNILFVNWVLDAVEKNPKNRRTNHDESGKNKIQDGSQSHDWILQESSYRMGFCLLFLGSHFSTDFHSSPSRCYDGLFGIPAKNRKGCRLQVGEWRYLSTNLSNRFSWDFFRFRFRRIKTQGRVFLRFFQRFWQEVLRNTLPRSSKNSFWLEDAIFQQKEVFLKNPHFQVQSRFFFLIWCYLRFFSSAKNNHPTLPCHLTCWFWGFSCDFWVFFFCGEK